MADKRRADRRPARIRVRFWRPGEPDHVQQGYTTNISGTGAFVQTDHPHPKGRRLQVEFTADRNGFVCEALVARAIKVAPELQSARKGGMGLRFLSVEELLEGFLPEPKSRTDVADALSRPADEPPPGRASGSATDDGDADAATAPERAPVAKGTRELEATSRRVAARHPAAAPSRSDATADATSSGEPAHPGEMLTFRLSPPSLDVVRALYLRQIEPGILILPSRTDCRVGLPVRIELKTPPSPLGQRILAFEGEVLECGAAENGEASTLRVQIRTNAAARDFLHRLLDLDPPTA